MKGEGVGSFEEDSFTSKDKIRICVVGTSALSSFSHLVVFIESHNQPALQVVAVNAVTCSYQGNHDVLSLAL